MKKALLKTIIKIAHWLMTTKGTQLIPNRLIRAGWEVEHVGHRTFYIEPIIKRRDKVWVEFEHHYYRVYHGEDRTFVALESSLEWLQFYLFSLDKNLECDTRHLL